MDTSTHLPPTTVCTPSPWYADLDGDGYGDPASSVDGCTAPAGHVADGTDCDDADVDNWASCSSCVDLDGDGAFVGCDAWTSRDQDCDDAAVTVFPGAPELCDGLANDCDIPPSADEVDDDADGYVDCAIDAGGWSGDPGVSGGLDCDDADVDNWVSCASCVDLDGDGTFVGCDAWTTRVEDCDDTESSAFPGAPELCDGLVNDCGAGLLADEVDDDGDGYVECMIDSGGWDGDPSVTSGSDCDDADVDNWVSCASCLDTDGDGSFVGCDAWTIRVEDCDDSDGANSPLLTETCGDSADNDCDGVADEGCTVFTGGSVPLGTAGTKLTGEGQFHQSGAVVAIADLDGDGYGDLVIGAPRENTNGSVAGAAYVVRGSGSGVPGGSLAGADAKLLGSVSQDSAGSSVAGAGDLDGDGYGDLLVGAKNGSANYNGAMYVLRGGPGGISSMDLSAADATLTGEAAFDDAGFDGHAAGDVDDDGYDDFLVGAPGAALGGNERGSAYLVMGSATLLASQSLATAGTRFDGEADWDNAGHSVAGAGDTNGDGYDDVLVGAPFESTSGNAAGAVYLLLGGPTGIPSGSLAFADAKLLGPNANDHIGVDVDCAGDVNGDGYEDVIAGGNECSNLAPLMSDPGCALVVHGSAAGIPSMDLDLADSRLVGENDYDFAGVSVTGAGDVDGDGFDDVLIGATSAVFNRGAVYLVLGGPSGVPSIFLDQADAILEGEASGDSADASAAGDVDGDGRPDIAVGAHGEDTAASVAGATYLVLASDL